MFAPASFMVGANGSGRKRPSVDSADLEEILRRQELKQNEKKNPLIQALDFIASDIYLFSTLTYAFWIFCGLVWYKYYSNWTWATAYYYTIEAGLSIGFCYPAEKEDWSKLFTIFYVLIGSSVVSGCLGLLATSLVSTRVSLVAAQHGLGAMNYRNEDNQITFTSVSKWLWYHTKYLSGWYTHRSRTIIVAAFIIWMGLGTAYGMVFEHWTFITALYWAVTSSSTGGLQSPPCESGSDEFTCNMGNLRGTLMGIFMMVGVPLYAAAIGQFAHIAVGRAIAAREEKMLSRPIEDAEFIFAANILSPEGSQTLVLGEYILLELLRLGQTNQQQIEVLKKRFYALDKDKVGELAIWDLQRTGQVVPRKLHSIELARRLRSRSIELFPSSPIKIRRSVSKEMFTPVVPPPSSFEVTSAEIELAKERRFHPQKSFRKSLLAPQEPGKPTLTLPNISGTSAAAAETKADVGLEIEANLDTPMVSGKNDQVHRAGSLVGIFDDFDYNGEEFSFDDANVYVSPEKPRVVTTAVGTSPPLSPAVVMKSSSRSSSNDSSGGMIAPSSSTNKSNNSQSDPPYPMYQNPARDRLAAAMTRVRTNNDSNIHMTKHDEEDEEIGMVGGSRNRGGGESNQPEVEAMYSLIDEKLEESNEVNHEDDEDEEDYIPDEYINSLL